MNGYVSSYHNPDLYIPGSLGEVHDLLGSTILWAPTLVDESGVFPDRGIDSPFRQLLEGFGAVRKKLGEERHAKPLDLAARAKALFAEDPEDDNGKTGQGRALPFEIEDLIREARARRVRERLKDDDGEITGD